jgi:UDP-2-acetamido-3-amino-2,3-dideoxy-glucuronate N-acetyltransferase
MSADPPTRDDRQLLKNLHPATKILLGCLMYIPSSGVKKGVYRQLGARIGKNVYFGPGSLLISGDFHHVTIGEGAFIAPGVMMYVNRISIGPHATIGYQSLFVGESISVGKRCNINNRTFIESGYAGVEIGDHVTIAASVKISTHDASYQRTQGLGMKKGPVVIRDYAFIGNNAVILPGIEIGKRAIVGAGAVVTRDVPDDSVVAGVPARPLDHTKSAGSRVK